MVKSLSSWVFEIILSQSLYSSVSVKRRQQAKQPPTLPSLLLWQIGPLGYTTKQWIKPAPWQCLPATPNLSKILVLATYILRYSDREHSGSVVECLTRDWGAAGLSLTSATALCPWARHINPSLVLVQPRKTCPDITERCWLGRKESNIVGAQESRLNETFLLSTQNIY